MSQLPPLSPIGPGSHAELVGDLGESILAMMTPLESKTGPGSAWGRQIAGPVLFTPEKSTSR